MIVSCRSFPSHLIHFLLKQNTSYFTTHSWILCLWPPSCDSSFLGNVFSVDTTFLVLYFLLFITSSLCSSLHLKDTVPKIRNQHSQKWDCTASFPNPKFMYLLAIYIFSGSVCLFVCSKIGGPIMGMYINRSQIRKLGTRPCTFISGNI